MTYPDDIRLDGDDDEAALDPSQVSGHTSDANEADLIEQATAVPAADDDGFDR